MRAIVLAGGKGRRLTPYTYILPKPLMPIGDMPILEVVLIQLRDAGFDHITISIGHLGSLIEAFFGDGSKWGLNVDYFFEERPLGTAGCIAQITNTDDDFLVMNGDILCDINFSEFAAYHHDHQGLATIATYNRQLRSDFGVLEIDSENNIQDYIEKPTHELTVSMGIYFLKKEIREFLQNGESIDFPVLIKRLLLQKKKVVSYPNTKYWLDIGREDDYRKANTDFERLKNKFIGQ